MCDKHRITSFPTWPSRFQISCSTHSAFSKAPSVDPDTSGVSQHVPLPLKPSPFPLPDCPTDLEPHFYLRSSPL